MNIRSDPRPSLKAPSPPPPPRDSAGSRGWIPELWSSMKTRCRQTGWASFNTLQIHTEWTERSCTAVCQPEHLKLNVGTESWTGPNTTRQNSYQWVVLVCVDLFITAGGDQMEVTDNPRRQSIHTLFVKINQMQSSNFCDNDNFYQLVWWLLSLCLDSLFSL